MTNFDKVKKILSQKISDNLLIAIIFEMSRYFDKNFTKLIKDIQKENNIIIDSPTRKILRKKYYYGNAFKAAAQIKIPKIKYTQQDIQKAFSDCYLRLNTYDQDKIIESIKKRIDDLNNNVKCDSNSKRWLKEYDKRRENKKYSLAVLKLNQIIYKTNNYNDNVLIDFIINCYEDLENYRYLAIIIENEIYNKNNECITWQLLYKASIFAENFIQYSDKFLAFHKEEQISILSKFLKRRKIDNAEKIANNFYNTISCGFKFEDCYISDKQNYKILILKKIELNEEKIPCPSCNKTIISGNSYPEMFLKSWECKNPSCPDRSKSGRGKRYDEYGAYRYFKLVEQDKDNVIDNKLYQEFHRDIFDSKNSITDFLIKEYSFAKENLLFINLNCKNNHKRIIINKPIKNKPKKYKYVENYDNLPIVKLFKDISSKIIFKKGNEKLKKDIEIINDDSTIFLQKLFPSQIGTAITSPPYYNAREYSQWDNLLLYLCDMLINCKTIYNSMNSGGYYLYNIGDVVAEDNIYIKSHMSKHRIQLGFLSSLIFELAGYNLTGNIIWDKGEVQSKRNSTINLFSGYVKCINCYEHILVFRKGKFEKLSNSVEQIIPVIKINCKGENLYKHTAPYPKELVNLISPYTNKKLYVLDPYLGSGTTLKWCKENNIKGIGIELNKEYYNLCKENLAK